jgi:hypothetical protein
MLKRSILIGLSALLVGVGAYGGLTYLSTRMTVKILGFIAIDVGTAYASPATQFSWVNAVPVTTDDVHFEWINGRPYIYMNTTASDTYDFTNDPTTKSFGVVAVSTTYYAKGSAPSNPVVDGDCTYTLTSTGSAASDIDIHGHNSTGGGGMTLVSGAPGANQFRVTAYKSGDNTTAYVVTTSDQEFKDNLAASGHFHWDFSFETGSSFTEVEPQTTTLTLTARAHS